ncbi:MAG TPA: HAMP domain-containing protein, partial [Polyangia bacterium]|nr:HAMP domain-containing protein [Polyangia bacterium]
MTPSASAPAKTGRHQRSIKNYLLDAPFQLKYTAYLVGVALVISVVLGVFLYSTSRKVVQESDQVAQESKKVSDVVKMSMKNDPIYGDNPELMKSFNESSSDSDNKVQLQQDRVASQQRQMLWSVVGGLSLLVILIGLLGIYITHKIAGPVFKMKQLLKQVAQGKLNFPRRGLRKGDELQHFFDSFLKMADDLKARQQNEVELLEAGIAAAKGAGVSE